MHQHYILVGHNVEPASLLDWGQWLETSGAARQVAIDKLEGCEVSTVFIGLNLSYTDKGPPLIFETMIFGGPLDGRTWRCSTWKQAEMQHIEAVSAAKAAWVKLQRRRAKADQAGE